MLAMHEDVGSRRLFYKVSFEQKSEPCESYKFLLPLQNIFLGTWRQIDEMTRKVKLKAI